MAQGKPEMHVTANHWSSGDNCNNKRMRRCHKRNVREVQEVSRNGVSKAIKEEDRCSQCMRRESTHAGKKNMKGRHDMMGSQVIPDEEAKGTRRIDTLGSSHNIGEVLESSDPDGTAKRAKQKQISDSTGGEGMQGGMSTAAK